MEPRSLPYLASACGGELLASSPVVSVTRIQTDSRLVQRGDLFLALKGERFDGHDFLAEVVAKGAVAVIVARQHVAKVPPGVPAIIVDDTRAAYGQIATTYRREFELP